MSWKLIVIGGLVFYLVMFALSFVTGIVIHEGILEGAYKANSHMWLPELTQDPPDMGALMPRWIAAGLFGSFILAAIYDCIRSAFIGPGWKRGLFYGLILFGFSVVWLLGYSGFIHLPSQIWIWWAIDSLILYLPAAVALGAVGEKVAP